MIPILFDSTATTFTTQGLGRLSSALSCTVEEERNGAYELTMTYPVGGQHYDEICEGNIIVARHADTTDLQPFRIYKITRPINRIVTINARHISYDLNRITVAPFTSASLTALFSTGLTGNVVNACPFTFATDKTVATSYTVTYPSTIRSLLGGVQGSILDVYGGEYEFDGYTVNLWQNRGANNGVTIRYGKNLTDIKREGDSSGNVTAVLPYWVGTDENGDETIVVASSAVYSGVGFLQEYVDSNNNIYTDGDEEYEGVITPDFCIPLDLSEEFSDAPTESDLETEAQSWLSDHATVIPSENIAVSFVQLWQTNEYAAYAPLQRVKLCDTVNVEYAALGVTATAKVIKVKYNVLLERYDSMELGDAKSTLASTIANVQNTITKLAGDTPTLSRMAAAIEAATNLIAGGLGGHVVINRNADGEPNEILIMDTDDIATAVNVIRMNLNGIGFSSTGYNGPFTTAWTIDGHFNANWIDTGTLTTILLQGPNSDTYWDLATGIWQSHGQQTVSGYDVNENTGVEEAFTWTVDTDINMQGGVYEVRGSHDSVDTTYVTFGVSAESATNEYYSEGWFDQPYAYAALVLRGDEISGSVNDVDYNTGVGSVISATYSAAGSFAPDSITLGETENIDATPGDAQDTLYPDRNKLILNGGYLVNPYDAIEFVEYAQAKYYESSGAWVPQVTMHDTPVKYHAVMSPGEEALLSRADIGLSDADIVLDYAKYMRQGNLISVNIQFHMSASKSSTNYATIVANIPDAQVGAGLVGNAEVVAPLTCVYTNSSGQRYAQIAYAENDPNNPGDITIAFANPNTIATSGHVCIGGTFLSTAKGGPTS